MAYFKQFYFRIAQQSFFSVHLSNANYQTKPGTVIRFSLHLRPLFRGLFFG